MGFKDDVRAFGADLERRVTALEKLAGELRRERASAAEQPSRAATTRDPITGSTVRPHGSPLTVNTTGVDYGAIAFGLSEIKSDVTKIVERVQSDRFDERIALDGFRDAVQYFADVFAKTDSSFDADAFKRQSGV